MAQTPNVQKSGGEELADIENVSVDIDLPIDERIRQYIGRIKNPYRFRAGGVIVNIEHLDNGLTLESAFSSYIDDLM